MPPLSPRLKARIAGALYLISGQAFAFAEFSVRGHMVVGTDAAATARNILANELRYRWSVAVELVPLYLVVTFILYDLLVPVNRRLSQLAYVFSLVGCTVSAVNSVLHLAPLVILRGANALSGEQREALALIPLQLSAEGLNVSMVFFGLYCASIGYLILRSTFLPRIIGGLLMLAGVCYLTNSFAGIIAPDMAARMYPYILAPGVAELILAVWLLIVGVNEARWTEQQTGGTERIAV